MNRLLLPLVSLFVASPLGAQTHKELMIADWERDRANVLAFVDVMPESLFDFRPTPGVRSYAEQIEHIVLDHVGFVASGVEGLEELPVQGDASVYLSDKDALREYVDRGFDYVIEVLRGLSPEEFNARASGSDSQVPTWRIFETAREHGIWTLGQLIPYVRLNDLQPPEYALYSAPAS